MKNEVKIVLCKKCHTDTPHLFSGVTATPAPGGWVVAAFRCAICATEVESFEPPRVDYLFIGGPLDGQQLTSTEAEECYFKTDECEIGLQFTPPNSVELYEVVDKKIRPGEVHLRAKHVGEQLN